MKKEIDLLDSIMSNMKYIKLLLAREHFSPLHTYYLVMKKLNKLKEMLDETN